MAIVTDTVAVQRFAMGLFGVQVGSVTMAQVDKQIDRTSVGATLNSYYASAFGGQTTAAVAATLVKNLGITGAGVDGAVAYVTGALNAAAPAVRGEAISIIINLFSGLTADATYGAAAQAWNANVDVAAAYTGTANIAFGAVIHHSLTNGMDTLFGSALADVFTADLSSGGNTLQGGDSIDGGAGNDTLTATLGNLGEGKAITAKTTGIEKVIIQAQSRSGDSGDNNVANEGIVNVDAARMSGVNNWENSNSRADLIVEDVRIADNQITKDITITMRETDPGNVDFGVYFDQNSLRSSSASSSKVFLEVMDTRAVLNKLDPLLNSPYTGFAFTVTDSNKVSKVVELKSDAINAALTYKELAAAFQVAADKEFGAGAVTVTVGADFTVKDTLEGTPVVGQTIVLTTNGAYTFSTPAGTSGWLAAGVSPANSGLHTNFSDTPPVTNTELVTSTIVLDDVGRGSTGGDLVIGGLSVGETSTSKGVERFNITVEDNSKLQTVNSTNNTLREVSIVNGTTTRVNNAYNENVKDAGNLTVTGLGANNIDALEATQADIDNILPGLDVAEHGAYGFTDVRLIDASTFKGKLDLDAQLTDRVVAKYLTLTDKAPAAAAADNVNFDYLMGTNNDKFMLNVAKGNLDTTSGTTTREDLVVNIKGNEGNDTITTQVGDGQSLDYVVTTPDNLATPLVNEEVGTSAFQNWYLNSKLNGNLNVDGGVGNDTINLNGGGDWKVTGGAGDDVVYANNMVLDKGPSVAKVEKAKWVLNGLSDGTSNRNDKNFMSGVKMSVTFKHITATVDVASTGGFTSDLQINQAIKQAIANDATLSKLIVAKDGLANSLVIESLIEGAAAADDFAVAFARPATISAAEANTLLNSYRAAYKAMGIDLDGALFAVNSPADAVGDVAKVKAIMDAQIDALTHDSGTATPITVPALAGLPLFAKSEFADYAGKYAYLNNALDSFGGTADHTITLGAGADIAVLGSDINSNDTLVYAADEEFGKDTVVNFKAGALVTDAAKQGNGADKFDFTALGGDMLASTSTTSAVNHVQAVNALTGGVVATNFENFATSANLKNVGAAGLDYATNSIVNAIGAAGTPTYGDIDIDRELTVMPTHTTASLADRSITLMNLDQAWTSGTSSINDTQEELAAWFEAASANSFEHKHVVVVVDAHNVGTVYAVVDGAGNADASAKAMGSIDLADTQWSDLSWFNFA